jgi:hypothetical protein
MYNSSGFEVWKTILRTDCAKQDKLLAYDGLGDYVLRLLYDTGTEPTVEGVVRDGESLARERGE